MKTRRREFLAAGTLGAIGFAGALPLSAAEHGAERTRRKGEEQSEGKPEGEEVSALEDLMREHGVLARLMLVYEEGLRRLRAKKEVAPDVFARPADIVRKFVEDYHEKLEEKFIFPRARKRKELAGLVDVLLAQHRAGRALTDTIAANATAEALAAPATHRKLMVACYRFLRMYRPHAAREDTVLFPALHRIVPEAEMDELGEQFEKEEDRLFGEGGFGRMVDQVAALEKQLGIHDLARFTPKVK